MRSIKNLVILGATGSIGTQTLSVMREHPQRFRAHTLTAHNNVALMFTLCQNHQPQFAVMTDDSSARALDEKIRAHHLPTQVRSGMASILEIIADPEVDGVMCAMVGAVGIAPAYQAICQHKTVYLANKEAMVVAGALINRALSHSHSMLLPIDSEHNALFQCLPHLHRQKPLALQGVRKLWLTASGGPFRNQTLAHLTSMTPEQAIAHPKWKMGRKISVDSATLMNKGLEVIEAHFLYQVSADHIEVVIHPQSVIHSLVEYIDGSFLAQLSTPDMRTPIAHALGYPERLHAPVERLNPQTMANLEFSAPDHHNFPCLGLAYSALALGGNAPLVLNAANEIAVSAFLNYQCRFTDIADINRHMLEQEGTQPAPNEVSEIIDEDLRIRALTDHFIRQRYG